MTYDIAILGGQVVDGTGAAPVRADVAISGDRIARVAAPGELEGQATRTIDATGKLVTPGFIDIHTHLDAQVMWDPVVSSPCWHGITSVVMGNCGLSLAPASAEKLEFLVKTLESVEDIPADAILAGSRFSGGSFGDYLDVLDGLPLGINLATLVGHVAVRYEVMGERSMERTPATESEIEQMCALVDAGIRDGAFGFSTSRSLLHTTPDERHVPGTFAETEELLALGKVLERHGRGVYGSVPAVELGDAELHRKEIAWMREVSIATGRPFTFAVVQNRENPGLYREILDQVAEANRAGARLHPQTEVRSIGVVVGLANITPFDQSLAWLTLKELTLDERLAALRDPERRSLLVREGNEASGEAQLSLIHHLRLEDGNARYDFSPEQSLWAMAQERGVTPADLFIDMELESQGNAWFIFPFANFELDVVGEMLARPEMLLGLADSGAHVGQICDTSFSTFFLRYWVHEQGLFSVGDGIRKLTSEPAGFFGIEDRGVLREGMYADLNVFALDALRVGLPEFTHDLPAGAGRFIQKATGFDYTLVNGEVFMEKGEHAGGLAGRLLRAS
ncbi:MAG: amidohydrolase family protein [Deltaproteobacteria bacterium]|nr:amidohydrolase family protein [Deltaproteobacteria bacterium]MBW2444457.1 amidohydrolase family protein [Deltaproteobacteria bacterium]